MSTECSFARKVPAMAAVPQSLSTYAEAAVAAVPELRGRASCDTENNAVITSFVHALSDGDHMGLSDAAAHAPTEPEAVALVRHWMLATAGLAAWRSQRTIRFSVRCRRHFPA